MKCPDCGVELDILEPWQPGPVTSCDCGWYRMGSLIDEGDAAAHVSDEGETVVE